MSSFTDLVGCRLPLQLAGMGGTISDPGLASAVSAAGGLGMLGAGGLPAPVVAELVAATARATSEPFGVNFLMPFLDRDAAVAAAQRARVVELFYADPDGELVALLHGAGALVAWQVGSVEEAKAAVAAGCDVVVVQGTEAGGHVRGSSPLHDVLEGVVAAVDVPIVAAGGIGTAAAAARALEAGASAVRVGTRFLAASESTAHPDYVDALIAASGDDTVLTEAFSAGWPDAPHRVLRSSVEAARAAPDGPVATASMMGQEFPVERFSTIPPTVAVTGNVRAMALYAGTSVDAVTGRKPAAEIVTELCSAI